MSWTKRQLIEQAFDSVGLASFVFDLTPEQLNSALNQLDAMMASWEEQGVWTGYCFSDNQECSDLDQDSRLPAGAYLAVYSNLALNLAPSYGKMADPRLVATAKQSYNVLTKASIRMVPLQLPATTPVGAGNKGWGSYGTRFARPPIPPECIPAYLSANIAANTNTDSDGDS